MSIMLTRRFMLAAGLAAALALPAASQDKPTLRFSAVFSDQDIRAQMAQQFADAIAEEFTFEPYYGGTLFKPSPHRLRMKLLEARPLQSGCVILRYAPAAEG